MLSKHPRIAVTAVAELEAARDRRVAAEALFEAMDTEQFDLDLAAVDRLNTPPAAWCRPGSGTVPARRV
jgi:hypothetical protein